MKKWRIRLVERVHEDGVMAVEFVVSADNKDDAMFRAGLLMKDQHPTIRATWIAWVKEEA